VPLNAVMVELDDKLTDPFQKRFVSSAEEIIFDILNIYLHDIYASPFYQMKEIREAQCLD
jgi:hypothetical protein